MDSRAPKDSQSAHSVYILLVVCVRMCTYVYFLFTIMKFMG